MGVNTTVVLALGALVATACAAPKIAKVYVEGSQRTLLERGEN